MVRRLPARRDDRLQQPVDGVAVLLSGDIVEHGLGSSAPGTTIRGPREIGNGPGLASLAPAANSAAGAATSRKRPAPASPRSDVGQRQGQMLLPATAIALEEISKFQRVARQRYGSISKRLDRIARNLLDALVHLRRHRSDTGPARRGWRSKDAPHPTGCHAKP